jgi:tetraacyldisaccharide-1-P 4'-kinase
MLVTTEKDAARLSPAQRREVMALPVRLVFDEPEALERLLDRVAPVSPS